jgi:hypothetical protein
MAERPLQTMLAATIKAEVPQLAQLDLLVLTTNDEVGFITSDNPCSWVDPEIHKRPPFYQTVGLAYPSIEISLPVSPRQAILLQRQGGTGHCVAPDRLVDEINRRTRAYCTEYFVVNTKTTRPIWFDIGVEPEDSWRKHGLR